MDNIPKGYKKTEIGVIPEDWEVRKLGDIGDVKMCRRIFSYQTRDFDEVPFYKIGTFGKEPDAYISRELFQKYRKLYDYPNIGDILISASGTIGRTVVYDGKDAYFQDSNIIWIDNNEKLVSNNFLNYAFQRVEYDTEGGTIQRLYNSILKSTKFALPLPEEQHKISDTLSNIDSLITSLEKLIDKKKMIRQGVMQELLTGKRRLPVFSGEWREYKLHEISEIKKGSGLSKSKTSVTGKYKCILYGELFTQYDEVINSVKSYTNYKEGESSQSGDVLIPGSTTTSGIDLAKASAILEDDVLLGSDINIIRNSKNYFEPRFMAFLITKICKQAITKIAKGITIYHLHGSDLKEMEVTIPTYEEQKMIADYLVSFGEEISLLGNKLSKLKQIKQGAMQQLLTGKIRLINK